MAASIVSLRNVEKWYGNNHVVKDMNLEIEEGEFLTLLGPSGCGKTTQVLKTPQRAALRSRASVWRRRSPSSGT